TMLLTMVASGCLLTVRRVRQMIGHPHPGLFFGAAVVASAPLLGSAWRSPAMYFELLLLAVMVVLAFSWRIQLLRWTPATLAAPGSAALFLMLAEYGREALIFLAAACVALVASRGRLDLSRLAIVYAMAALILLVRLCLFFGLGDEYMVSAIRTAPGFRLVEFGLPLTSVISLLMLKYTLPWLVILAGVLPSLVRSGWDAAGRAIALIALGYVA